MFDIVPKSPENHRRAQCRRKSREVLHRCQDGANSTEPPEICNSAASGLLLYCSLEDGGSLVDAPIRGRGGGDDVSGPLQLLESRHPETPRNYKKYRH